MKELIIYEFQAKDIEDAFRLIANHMDSQNRETCLDRDIMQCWETIKNVLNGEPEKRTRRL